MKRSLLAVMAIMPTLLIGCKTKTLKEIIFSEPQVVFSAINESQNPELHSRPSGIKINFDEINWYGVSKDTSERIEIKDYVGIKSTEKTPVKPGGIVLEFTLLKDPGDKGIEVSAVYKDFTAVTIVQLSKSN